MNIHRRTRRNRTSGFTLLELMLAIVLTGVVMVLVGIAINQHVRTTERRREQVERAQLARAIAVQISRDIRATVFADTADFSNVSQLADTDSFLSGIEDPAAEIPDSAGDQVGDSAEDTDELVGNIATSASVSNLLGLYGGRDALLLDVSHLPSRDELARAAAGYEMSEPMGDVKSVAYYLTNFDTQSKSSTTAALAGQMPNTGPVPQAGLVRRVIDRAAERFNSQQGDSNDMNNAEVIAPEVWAIEFRYFDGTQWLEQWNSEEVGDLPLAVEVMIALHDVNVQDVRSQPTLGLQSANASIDPDSIYRFVVRLPTAQPVLDEENATEETDDTAADQQEPQS